MHGLVELRKTLELESWGKRKEKESSISLSSKLLLISLQSSMSSSPLGDIKEPIPSGNGRVASVCVYICVCMCAYVCVQVCVCSALFYTGIAEIE